MSYGMELQPVYWLWKLVDLNLPVTDYFNYLNHIDVFSQICDIATINSERMPHPKFNFLIQGTKPWKDLRKEEMHLRRRRINHDGQSRLVPGPLANPDLDRSLYRISTVVTEREEKEFLKLKPKAMTNSLFLRTVLCQFLEQHRRKDLPTMSFVDWFHVVDSDALCARSPAKPGAVRRA